jgi:hypothetical protein
MVISMGIPSAQLEIWSHTGSIAASKNTYDSIKACIDSHKFPEKTTYDVYLQGSYGNSTNIRGDSDVDVVIELTSSFQPNISKLAAEEGSIFSKKYSDSVYGLSSFRNEVVDCFKSYYDNSKISEGSKALKIEGYSGRLNSDIIIAIKYRLFFNVYQNQADSYVEGIAFQTKIGPWMHSYPKIHLANGVKKMSLTNNQFKSLVRVYKNTRGKLESDFVAPDKFTSSFLIESLIYNVPNQLFTGSISDIFLNSLKWLNEANLNTFKCQHELFDLFGASEGQCSISEAKSFISAIVNLWKNW